MLTRARVNLFSVIIDITGNKQQGLLLDRNNNQ